MNAAYQPGGRTYDPGAVNAARQPGDKTNDLRVDAEVRISAIQRDDVYSAWMRRMTR